ncbi:hypothetical protein ILYODFUR_016647 [Ilyodon furcidens]|uniref:Uncharacterized protein n=1 Tax=Ilyodon furcidens TaxID=33524 RepID=A0ABV0SXN6_9TELE
MSVARISSIFVQGPGEQVCGSSHSLLHIFIEKPCMHMRVHTQIHRCLDAGVNRYTNVIEYIDYIELHLPLNTSCIHKYRAPFSKIAGNVNNNPKAVSNKVSFINIKQSFKALAVMLHL